MMWFIRKMGSPITNFNRIDWVLLVISLLLVGISNILTPEFDLLTCIAALIGVTSLILAAKGTVWAPFLMIFFSIMYGVISWRFHYWGELITYVCMTLPMNIWAFITWFQNPSEENENEVAINKVDKKTWILLTFSTIFVTVIFYFILKSLKTPNLAISTVSITTSFAAASLTMLRSSYYALFYAMNDIVLIVLWILASMENPVYIPVVVNFGIFLVNDLYGYISWKKRE